jgi:hypothetical protein
MSNLEFRPNVQQDQAGIKPKVFNCSFIMVSLNLEMEVEFETGFLHLLILSPTLFIKPYKQFFT